jgi:cellulose synthase/poly-beta-1,6-N-acetylglucosamine synthase-like glycosyltransferase
MNIFYEIFWEPIRRLSFSEILLILSISLVFDLFWQYTVRILVITYKRWVEKYRKKRHAYQVKKLKSDKACLEKDIRFLRDSIAYFTEEEDFAKAKELLPKLSISRLNLEIVKDRLSKIEDREKPFISIIVPTHNGEKVIEETIEALLEVDYEKKEIIVVDDASTDKTYLKAKKFVPGINLVRRVKSTGYKTSAVNFGVTFAKGEYVLVVDDDTILEKDLLKKLAELMGDPKAGAVSANVRVLRKNPRNILETFQEIEYLIAMELSRPYQDALFGGVFVASGACSAFNKDLLARIGQYDIDIITEDLDVTWKVYKAGKKVKFTHNAIAYTIVPDNLKAFLRQRLRWDKGLFETLSKHRNLMFRPKFTSIGIGLLPETLLIEVLLLIIKPIWWLYLLFSGINILSLLLLMFYFYILFEILVIFTAGLLSVYKKDAIKTIYAPAMVFYHQFLSFLKWRALLTHLFGKRISW